MAKPKAAQLVKVIEKCNGNMTAIAASYGVARSTAYSWVDSYETAQQALNDARERRVDIAEDVLGQKVEAGDMNAIFYTLNNQKEARARGWGVRQTDITSDGDKIASITYIVENRPDDD